MHLHLFFGIAAWMGLAAPAIAAGDQSIEQQYRAAAETFTAGIGGAEHYLKEYAAQILEGLRAVAGNQTNVDNE